MSEALLEKRLRRAKAQVAILEEMIEQKTRALYLANEELKEHLGYLRKLQALIPAAILVIREDGSIRELNRSAYALLGIERGRESDLRLRDLWPEHPSRFSELSLVETEWMLGGEASPVLLSTASVDEDPERGDVVFVVSDLRRSKRMEVELRHAQKLESIGSLAAGVAHEINTPMQFVGDNVAFLQESFGDLLALVEKCTGALCEGPRKAEVERWMEEADLAFVRERLPKSFVRTTEGIERVNAIVAAMKAFSHPGRDKAPADLNEALVTTLAVAKNEYRYVADVREDYGELPLVHCVVGDLNQVFLNLIVNAAQAIEAHLSSGSRGEICITTGVVNGFAEVKIKDNGGGIDEEIQSRVFDPFFTTKAVGKGTGQGLSLAHAIVSERHGGTIHFESEAGVGTTFVVRIPIAAAGEEAA